MGINLVLRASYLSAAKSATSAFWVFLTFYVVCAAITWFAYVRRPHGIESHALRGRRRQGRNHGSCWMTAERAGLSSETHACRRCTRRASTPDQSALRHRQSSATFGA